jgi:hypothetical protein
MELPIYRFVVPEDDDEIGVDCIALVDYPAIEMNWQAFNSQFVVEPKADESKDEFIGRCIAVEVGNGYDQEQAAAICYSKWDKNFNSQVNIIVCKKCGHSWNLTDGGAKPYMCKCGYDNTPTKETFESYTDYPQQATENAKIALRYAEENGWGDCGTEVGKQRANQLAKREPLSRDTIARMAAFERHRQNSQKELGDGCGRLMWLCWGGDEGVEWAQRKLEQIDAKKFSMKFTADVEKRIISGPLMVANLPIYRKDETGEYYGIFTATDIYNIVKKFFRKNNTAQVNMMHDSSLMLKDVYMIESFMIDNKRGIYSPAGYNLTEGSWFGSFKVDNEEVWDDYVKTGKFKGFSVEGMFKTVKIDDKPQTAIDKIIEVVKNIDPSKVAMARAILKKANL